MGKTYKDKPEQYLKEPLKRKPKEKRFESSKGRKNNENIKKNLEDYFI